MTCFISTLPGPALGRRDTPAGQIVSSMYGDAIPRPMNTKAVSAVAGSWDTAQAMAAPISGAVHGVERTAVSTPIQKEPPSRCCCGLTRVNTAGMGICGGHINPTAITPITVPTKMVNQGYWNN